MEKIQFMDESGAFSIKNPENYSALYFPVAGEKGLREISGVLWKMPDAGL